MMTKVLPAPADELMGFVPFYPRTATRGVSDISLIFRGRYIRLSQTAIESLKLPEYVVVFLDRIKRRMMIMPATEQDRNALKLAPMPNSVSLVLLYNETLKKDVMAITGRKDLTDQICPGYSVNTLQPAIIFNLDDIESRGAR